MLLEALKAQQRDRWRRGDRVQVEDFLRLRPPLQDTPEAFTLVYHEFLLREELGEGPTLEEYGRFVRAILLPNQEVWVAEDDEQRVVGWFSLTKGSLEHIYVDPERQNRGLGSEMLAAVIERLPDGFSLWTFQKNEGARRFYERHGLDAVEFTDGRDNMEREPDVRYEWAPD